MADHVPRNAGGKVKATITGMGGYYDTLDAESQRAFKEYQKA